MLADRLGSRYDAGRDRAVTNRISRPTSRQRRVLMALLVVAGACGPADPERTPPPPTGGQCAFRVCISGLRSRQGISYVATNDAPVPATVGIRFRQIVNLGPAITGSLTRIVPAGERVTLTSLYVVERRRGFNAQPVVTIDLGSDSVTHDAVAYTMPFGGNDRRRMVSGAGGPTHLNENFYSFDFEMPEGTPVLAARSGTVVYVQDGFTEGGLLPDLIERANLVSIGHSDGTIASYGHLREGLEVRVGDVVTRGQLLGWSGSTGFSGRPHLHFHVGKRLIGGVHRTIPVSFEASGSDPVELEEGAWYEPGEALRAEDSSR
jgi:murein DD-endopeptidase MepM/ murein hydrolase activator NlpD